MMYESPLCKSSHLLEFTTDETEYCVLMSLLPTESVSVAVSKLKGRISKWLNEQRESFGPGKRLARGYFAITTGGADAESVDRYLEGQAAHHGYDRRARPPVFVQQYNRSDQDRQSLQTDHAVTVLRYHLVFATQFRRGVFATTAADSVCDRWLELQESGRFLIDKVSFLPDHVHVAVSVHPAIKPGDLAVVLMNSAQELMWQAFDDVVLKAGVERLWQPSAYVGSFGDLKSNAISTWLKRWDESSE